MTFEELLELRRTQGPEAANEVLKTMSLEQMRDITIEANKQIINLANLFVATYMDYAVEANLPSAQKAKQDVDFLIKKVNGK